MAVALVTGAHGFLGRHVALELMHAGYEVHGIGHGAWPGTSSAAWGLTSWTEADVDLVTLTAMPTRPRLVVHCAGGSAVGPAEDDPPRDFERTVHSTACVMEALRRCWPEARLVFTSSAAVYGQAKELPIRESAPPLPLSVYGLHKLLAEDLLRFHAQRHGLALSVIRLFSVYGAGLRKQLFWDACRRLEAGQFAFPGTGHETRDWVHVRDAARLLRMAGEVSGRDYLLLNGGVGKGRTVKAALSHLAQVVAPGIEPTFTGQVRPGDPQHFESDISRAASIGWQPQESFEQSIREYGDWYRSARSP